METLHTIARAMNVKTSQLLAEDPPERERHNRPERLNLRDLRIALTPPIALSAPAAPQPPDDEPDIHRLLREAKDAALLYPAGRYESLAASLPGLVRAADVAVAYYADGEERRKALLARAEVFHLVGLYLTQIRQFDIAHTAVRGAISDAREADDSLAVAAKAQSLCFVLLRTGRFDEAEVVAVDAMDLVEPEDHRCRP